MTWVIGWLTGCAQPTPVEVAPDPTTEASAVDDAFVGPLQGSVADAPAEPAPPPEPPPPPPPPRPKDPYLALRYDIDQDRQALVRREKHGEQVMADAQLELQKRLPELIDRWKGTRWSYSGTTETPKQGKIACGYFVSTVLLHMGFAVDRVDLARQPSEQILRTVIPEDHIDRFSWATRDTVVNRVEAQGPGVYLVGLDTHIGFLVNQGDHKVNFCHSSSRNHKMGVVCELARTSPSLKSRLTVVGKLGFEPLITAWLTDVPLPAAHKGLAQPLALLATPPKAGAVAGASPMPGQPGQPPGNDGVAGTL